MPNWSTQVDNAEIKCDQLLALCNHARQAIGVAPLQWSQALSRVARQHAQAMAMEGYFDHVDRQGRGVGERLNDSGYRYRWAGENISAGLETIDAVFAWWMQSDGHRANILSPNFTELGLGHHFCDPDHQQLRHYWVQVFGTRLPD